MAFQNVNYETTLMQICPGEWFISVVLKEPPSQAVLEIHFRGGGIPIYYSYFPTLCAFTKCVDAVLSPLRQMGIRILNYLDDWLLIFQWEWEPCAHRSLLISHQEHLGFRVNSVPVVTLNSTTIESPETKNKVKILPEYRHSRMCSASGWLPNYHLIGHGTMQSTYCLGFLCPDVEFTYCPSWSRGPWRSTFRRHYIRNSLDLPHPQPLPASSLLQKGRLAAV